MMGTTTRLAFALGFLLSTSGVVRAGDTKDAEEEAGSAEDEAGTLGGSAEPGKTLAERIPSVTRRAFVKQGRLEVYPAVSMSLNDPFFDHVIATGGLSFHVLESLAIGIAGDYFLSVPSVVSIAGGSRSRPAYNRPVYSGRLEVTWAPLYGKISFFAEKVLHFDAYLIAGGGVVGPLNGDPAPAGVIGIGQRYFLSDWFALRLEVRDQIFRFSRNPSGGKVDPTLQNLLSAVVGLCFYIPPDFEREAL